MGAREGDRQRDVDREDERERKREREKQRNRERELGVQFPWKQERGGLSPNPIGSLLVGISLLPTTYAANRVTVSGSLSTLLVSANVCR